MTGVLLGLGFAVGMISLVAGWHDHRRRPPLLRAVRAVHSQPTVGAHGGWSGSWRWLVEATASTRDLIARLFGGRSAINTRLERAGRAADSEAYLLQQNAFMGLGAAAALLFVLLVSPATSPAGVLALMALGAACGALAGDWRLGRQVRARQQRIGEQFPVAADLFALAVAAGLPPRAALAQVAPLVGGALGEELQRCVSTSGQGMTTAASLRQMAERIEQPTVGRFVESVVSALERGTPVSEVARAQALDARHESHRRLMETAGKKDVLMLIPVVFIVLPLVVVLALFPGAVNVGLIPG